MARYRQRRTVEAEQVFWNAKPWPPGVAVRPEYDAVSGSEGCPYVEGMLEGCPVRVRDGDWVMRGEDGGLTVISTEAFEENYERVDTGEPTPD